MKKLLLTLSILLFAGNCFAAFPTTGILDAFDRANENPITGSWVSDGGADFQVISQQLAPTVYDSYMYWTSGNFADQEFYFTVIVKGNHDDGVHIYFRNNGTPNFYGYKFSVNYYSNTLVLSMYDGTEHGIASYNQTVSNNDSVGYSAIGSTLTVYYKASGGSWVELGHITDTSYTSGQTELEIYEHDNINQRLDNFGGGTYAPTSGTWTTGEKMPTSATTSATGAHIDDDFVRTAAIMTANAGTADAACISAATFDAGDQTYILKATNFDFSGILAGSQINGVICRFEGWANTSGATAVSVACDLAQLLNTSRTETGENIVSSGLWTTVFLSATTGIVSLGNSANLWSCALTADWVKNANFGVALGFITGINNTDVFIDYVTLEIVYTPPAAVAALSLMYHFIEC